MLTFWVYILGSHTGTLHIGVTGDLEQRLEQHRVGLDKAFTYRCGVHRLLYAEETPDVFSAIAREKQLKGWTRSRRIQLITLNNPSWKDLAPRWGA
jgi:putative endonuclease